MFKKVFIIVFMLTVAAMTVLIVYYFSQTNQAKHEIENLNLDIAGLQQETEQQKEDLDNNEILIGNLNKLLRTVYYGSSVPVVDGGIEKNFTAFTMYYNENYYLITAGHCIEQDGVKYTGFRFKSNESNFWITPDLLYYESDYENNRDFAIFNYEHVSISLLTDENDKEPKYVLGNMERNINYFKEFNTAFEGESGSPILSKNCKLVGIVIKNNSDYTPISEVTNAIDRITEE